MEVRQKCISPGRSRNVSEVWSRGGAWSLGAMLGRLWLPCGQDQEQASASLTFRNCFDWQAERNPSEWMCSCCSVVAAIRAWLCCCSSRSRAEWAQFWRAHWHLPSVPVWAEGQGPWKEPVWYLPAGLFLQTGSGRVGGGHGACTDEQLFLVIAFSFPSL